MRRYYQASEKMACLVLAAYTSARRQTVANNYQMEAKNWCSGSVDMHKNIIVVSLEAGLLVLCQW